MTCDDCIHCEKCFPTVDVYGKGIELHLNYKSLMQMQTCDYFSDKSLYIKLPCKVGEYVYILQNGKVVPAKVIAFYFDGFGGMFDIQPVGEIGECKAVIKDYGFPDIGKMVFLKTQEAEAALKGE